MRHCWATGVLLISLCARCEAGQVLPTLKRDPSGYSKVVVLWPGGAPGALGTKEIDVPKLYYYPVKEAGKTHEERVDREEPHGGRAAVIVMPGGGYTHLAIEKEGGGGGAVAERAWGDGVCAGVSAGTAIPLPFSDAGWRAGGAVCAQPCGGAGCGEGQDWAVGLFGGRPSGGLPGSGARRRAAALRTRSTG